MREAKCKGCGATIIWGLSEDGKKIPLDPKPAVYRITNPEAWTTLVERDKLAMVSHFITCPKRDQFSGKGKKS